MKTQIKVTVVVNELAEAYIRARIGKKTVVLRPDTARTGGLRTYVSVDSAQRAWRKYADKHGISNYVYAFVTR